jgi:hypothetical protein
VAEITIQLKKVKKLTLQAIFLLHKSLLALVTFEQFAISATPDFKKLEKQKVGLKRHRMFRVSLAAA